MRRPSEHEIDFRLYSDGGTLSSPKLNPDGTHMTTEKGVKLYHNNPSIVGVTWAWVLVSADDEREVRRDSGHLLCPINEDGRVWPAQSDVVEFFAGMIGLESVPAGVRIEYLTDNLLTILRMFHGSATATIPPSWVARAAAARRRFARIWPTHLNGHPTREHLAQNFGHSGAPVSRWNDVADQMCRAQKKVAWEAVHALEAQADEPTLWDVDPEDLGLLDHVAAG